MARAFLLLVAAGCGGGGLRAPIELYPPAERGDLALSATGDVATIQRYETFDPDDDPDPRVEVMRRVGDVRRIGVSHGKVVDRPSERDALIITERLDLEWVVARRKLALGPALPRGVDWSYLGGAVDHAAGGALLLFGEAPAGSLEETAARRDRRLARLELLDVDVGAMRVRGARAVSIEGSLRSIAGTERAVAAAETRSGERTSDGFDRACSLAPAAGPRLFVTCRAPAPRGLPVERWIVTRYDRLRLAWSAAVPLRAPPRGSGPGAILSCVSGDGRSLVIEHGELATGIVEAQTTAVVDAATGAVRRFRRDPQDALGGIELLVPVPGRPAVAAAHAWYLGSLEHAFVIPSRSGAFLGISLTDTRTGRITRVLDTSDDAARHLGDANPLTLGVLPGGTFVVGYDRRRRSAQGLVDGL